MSLALVMTSYTLIFKNEHNVHFLAQNVGKDFTKKKIVLIRSILEVCFFKVSDRNYNSLKKLHRILLVYWRGILCKFFSELKFLSLTLKKQTLRNAWKSWLSFYPSIMIMLTFRILRHKSGGISDFNHLNRLV